MAATSTLLNEFVSIFSCFCRLHYFHSPHFGKIVQNTKNGHSRFEENVVILWLCVWVHFDFWKFSDLISAFYTVHHYWHTWLSTCLLFCDSYYLHFFDSVTKQFIKTSGSHHVLLEKGEKMSISAFWRESLREWLYIFYLI